MFDEPAGQPRPLLSRCAGVPIIRVGLANVDRRLCGGDSRIERMVPRIVNRVHARAVSGPNGPKGYQGLGQERDGHHAAHGFRIRWIEAAERGRDGIGRASRPFDRLGMARQTGAKSTHDGGRWLSSRQFHHARERGV